MFNNQAVISCIFQIWLSTINFLVILLLHSRILSNFCIAVEEDYLNCSYAVVPDYRYPAAFVLIYVYAN